MRTCFVILLLICISLMFTVQADNSTTVVTQPTASSAPPKPSGSENCVATLNILVMTLVTVFILQAKDWFC